VYDAATTPETGGKESLGRVDAWGWRGGATVLASDALRLHASVSRRSRFPALRELYSGALNRFQPNPNLKPEQLTGAELGATFGDAGVTNAGLGGFTFQAVGFHHRLKDAVVRTTVPNTRLFVRVNRDEIRSTGTELLGTWHSSADPGRSVSLTGDLLAQRVRVHDDSARAERRPEHQPEVRGSLELGVPLPALVRAFAGVRYTGTQYCVHPDEGNQVRLGGQTEGNLAVERSWNVGRGAGVFSMLRTVLALDNVTDRTVYDQCGMPQPGRTLRLSVQLR
jgi:iron complex outermembrane receptor protein